MKSWIILLLGWTCILIGVAGFFLPILPGFVFFIVGMAILSSRSRWAKRMMDRYKRRHPKEYNTLSHWKEKVKKAFRWVNPKV